MLSMTVVMDTVWVGFEHGYILVYSTENHCLKMQLWPRGKALTAQCMTFIEELNTVYVGFHNGTIWGISSEILATDAITMVTLSITPKVEFSNPSTSIASMLAITTTAQGHTHYDHAHFDPPQDTQGGVISSHTTQVEIIPSETSPTHSNDDLSLIHI